MSKAYQLYGWPGSGSVAVQIALEEIGAPYDRIWVGREPADIEKFRKVSPTAKSPALTLPDGTTMFESAAMLIHLAAAHPEARLAPQPGSSAHARFLQWMVFLSANVYEAVLRLYYAPRYSPRGDADAQAIAQQGEADYYTHLELIGRGLGPYVLGAEYSLADAYLYMLAGWAPGEKGAIAARLPRIGAHFDLVGARPAYLKVEADHAAT